jgi:phosphoglycerate dehydrogenase-like enzyme
MQILMSDTAHARVAADLPGDLDVLTLDAEGVVRRGADPVADADIDPEVFWISGDLFLGGRLRDMFRRVLAAGNARWAQTFNAGLDSPVFASIMAKGIRLTKSSAQGPAIAEYVVARAFSLLHPIAEARAVQAAHDWRRVNFREIASTRWLMVGFGAIGSEIAARLKPFGAHLTVVRRDMAPDPLADEVRPTADLPGLLPDADVVVLACALNDSTRGIAGAAFFAALKPGALLINIGRGGLVDEPALREGLDRDQPAMAVLDVFEAEPLPADAWFWDHPKIQLTAHCAAAGDGVQRRGDALFLENLHRYRAGQPLLNEAHPNEVGLTS